MSPPLRVAVIGAGDFGAEHVAGYRSLPDVDVVAVADRDVTRARAVAERFAVERHYGDARDMLDRCRPQAVSIVTPGDTHAELTLAAVDAGAAVLVEKPIAFDAADARTIAAAAVTAAAGGLPVLVGHVLRFASPYRAVRDTVAAGRLGTVHGLVAGRERSRDHATRFLREDLLDLTMIHDIDVALWLTGDTVRAVSGNATRDGAGRLALGQVQAVTASGALWSFSSSWLGAPSSHRDTLQLIGDRASAGLVLDAPALADVHAAALVDELRHICDCARSGRPSAVGSVADAVHALDVVLAARQSINQSGQWVDVPARDGGSR